MLGVEELDPDRAFAVLHVPARVRQAVAALWALDAMLGRFVAQAREPLATQIRLTWWHAVLTGLTTGTAQRDPLLEALVRQVLPLGVAGSELATLVEGWEAVLDERDVSDAALDEYASKRGTQLFALTARLIGAEQADHCGAGWALVDLSRRKSGNATSVRAALAGASRLSICDPTRIPRPLRVLVRLARDDVAGRARTRWSYWRAVR